MTKIRSPARYAVLDGAARRVVVSGGVKLVGDGPRDRQRYFAHGCPADVAFVQGDFTEQETYDRIVKELNDKPLDVVLSDMAPNMSGMPEVDQPRAMYLVELATELAERALTPGGAFVTKVFQGGGFDMWFRQIRDRFDRVVTRKPAASRPRSREVYIVASGFKGYR